MKAALSKIIHLKSFELYLSLLAFLLAFVHIADYNIVTDDYGTLTYFNLPAKQFSDFSSLDYYYNGLILISFLYKFLYSQIPSINWTGISFTLFTFSSLYIALHSLKKIVLGSREELLVALRIAQIVLAVVFLENFTVLAHTRFSLLLCGIALVWLVFSSDLSFYQKTLLNLLFVFSTLIRPESSVGMLLIVGTGSLIYKFDVVGLIKRIWFPVTFTTLLFTVIIIHWHYTDAYLIRVEPEIEYKAMAKHLIPLSEMKTAADSAKQVALGRGIWFDMKTMSPEYMRSILLSGVKHEPEHRTMICKHVANLYKSYFLLPLFTLIIAIGGLFFRNTRSAAMKSLLFQLVFFTIIFLLDYNRKMVAGRHFLNLLIVAGVIALVYFREVSISSYVRKYANAVLTVMLVLLAYGSYATIASYKNTTSDMYSTIQCTESVMDGFEKMFSGRTVVININSYPLLDHELAIKNKLYTKNRYILFDAFTYSLTPRYQDYLNRICQCDNQKPVDFFKWLIKEDALYISQTKRTDATANFMKAVHNYPIDFNVVLPLDTFSCMASDGMLRKMYVFNIAESK